MLFIKPMYFDRDGWPTMEASQAVSIKPRNRPESAPFRAAQVFDFLGRRIEMSLSRPGGIPIAGEFVNKRLLEK